VNLFFAPEWDFIFGISAFLLPGKLLKIKARRVQRQAV
jgi:hypothetical protein